MASVLACSTRVRVDVFVRGVCVCMRVWLCARADVCACAQRVGMRAFA